MTKAKLTPQEEAVQAAQKAFEGGQALYIVLLGARKVLTDTTSDAEKKQEQLRAQYEQAVTESRQQVAEVQQAANDALKALRDYQEQVAAQGIPIDWLAQERSGGSTRL